MTDFPVDIVRSARRKKTIQGTLTDGRIKVMVPADLDDLEERRLVEEMATRIIRKHASDDVDLLDRARQLARRYSLRRPDTIVWSNRQNMRWGSCTPSEQRIRISTRLTSMPSWVLDSVIVHELAHLDEPGHGPRFQELVARYPLTERARGYLMAKAEG